MDFIFDSSHENSDEIDSDIESALYSQLHYNTGDDQRNDNTTILPPVTKTDVTLTLPKNINNEERTMLDIVEPTEDKFEVLMDFLKNSKNSLLNGCAEPKPENSVADLTKSETESECSGVEKWQIIDSDSDLTSEKNLKLHVVETVEAENDDDNNWDVIEKDTQDLNTRDGSNRYFVSSRIRCKNCDETGHIASMCPQPKKEKTCHLCAQKGHLGRNCPKYVTLPYRHHEIECNRCYRCGHIQSECPELWRQYHLSVGTGHIVTKEIDEYKSKKKCCFLCKKKSHFAFDCPKTNTWHPYSMYITRYDHWMYIQKPIGRNDQIIGETKNKNELKTVKAKKKTKGLKRKLDNKSSKLTEKPKKKMKVSKEIEIMKKIKLKPRDNSKLTYKKTKLEITVTNDNINANYVKPALVKKCKKNVKHVANGKTNMKNGKRKFEVKKENENRRKKKLKRNRISEA